MCCEFEHGFSSGRRGRFGFRMGMGGPWGFTMGFGPMWGWVWEPGYRSKRALLRELEAYREALEEELAEVAQQIEELKRELGEE